MDALWLLALFALSTALERLHGRPFLATRLGFLLGALLGGRALEPPTGASYRTGYRAGYHLLEVAWLPALGFRASGQTWGELVLVRGGASPRLLAHEARHVEQFRRLGSLGLWLLYGGQWLLGLIRYRNLWQAYWQMGLERDARAWEERVMHEHALGEHYLKTVRATFQAQKRLGEGALAQLDAGALHWRPNAHSTSIAVIVKHLRGNMLSRWTDFLASDGEKASRDRDGEFEEDPAASPTAVLRTWEEGWRCLFNALDGITPDDLLKTVTVRGEAHSVMEALERQLSHYAYHVGQIVYLAKEQRGENWRTLSIPKGRSKRFKAG